MFNTTKEEMLDLERDDDSEMSNGEAVSNRLSFSASDEMDAIKNINANFCSIYFFAE